MAKNKPVPQEGLLDNILLAKVKQTILTMSEKPRIEAALNEAFEDMEPELVSKLAGYISNKVQNVLLPLVE